MSTLVESYAQREDVEQIYGKSNVSKWADLDSKNSLVDIDSRVTYALETTRERLHDRLRGGPLSLPVASPYPRTLVVLQAMMTGVWLYEARGVTDNDEGKHALMWHRKEIERVIADIHAGKLRLDTSDAPCNVPIVVKETPSSRRSYTEQIFPGFEPPQIFQ